MPTFEPFTGVRYAADVPLDDVISPPYDVVSPAERSALAARHRANAIHVELPVGSDGAEPDRYREAARLLESWMAEGILQRDQEPAFYIYRMTSLANSARTTGVIGALACEPPGGDILPHEQTIPKDRSDRLDLLRATRANLSPIWGLSLARGLAKTYEPSGPPTASATDDSGVVHELWVITDPARIEAIAGNVAGAQLVIADGHHRYETALSYQAERRQQPGVHTQPGGYDKVMAFVVELTGDELTVGPIHRTLSGIPEDIDVVEAFGRWFDTVHAGKADEQGIAAAASTPALALIARGDLWLLTPRDEAYQAAGSDLDSSLVALAVNDIPGAVSAHHHHWSDAGAALATEDVQAAVLLRPVTVEQIAGWAHQRRRMPPKSTYFNPKPRTGMVFRYLEG
ncbi:MAG: DUF1015 family protein [Acidimicrobiales bacterium]